MELLEREGHRSILADHFNHVEKGRGHTVFLLGEAGAGKTSLINLFIKKLEGKALIYSGACDSLFTPQPLGPLYDIAGQIGNHLLSILTGSKDRALMFASVLQELSTSAFPVVLVFEDIHWADEATVDFIKYLARRITPIKCLFLLTCRDNEIHSEHSLRTIFGELPIDTFSKLPIQPLSQEAVNILATAHGHVSGKDLYSLTGGNPFYVTEILACGIQRIPERVKDSILTVFHSKEAGMQTFLEFLSIFPSRIDLCVIEHFKSDFICDIDDCIWSGIIIQMPGHLAFRHELFRLAIEESLAPSKRKALHKKVVNVLLNDIQGSNKLSLLVHHARHADEKELVAKVAPLAAIEAASVGAHIEASKHYLTALEFADKQDPLLAELYECHAYECYLTNQVDSAIASQQHALDIWRERKLPVKTGSALRFMSRLLWFQGRRDEVMSLTSESISALETGPPSRELALSYSHLSQLYMIYNDAKNSLSWGQKAIEIAIRLDDQEVLSHALNNVGTVLLNFPTSQTEGEEKLNQSLSIALKNGWHEHIARAHSNLATVFVLTRQYEKARDAFDAGLKYCEALDLTYFIDYMKSEKVRFLLDTGAWPEAEKIALSLYNNAFLPGIIKIGVIAVLSRLRIRQGEFQNARLLISEGKKLAMPTREAHRIVPVLASELELCWITNDPIPEQELATAQRELFPDKNYSWYYSELAYWMNKCGILKRENARIQFTKPFHFEIMGDWRAAAEVWTELDCSYEHALALFDGEEEDQKRALVILNDLGASATYEMLKSRLKVMGVKNIPRGLRESTRSNPAQLTNRQIEILILLKDGLQNTEIADKLFISPKTVAHHISAILSQLEVSSRSKAVIKAVELGIFE